MEAANGDARAWLDPHLGEAAVDCYFGNQKTQLVQHHLDSYNDFVGTKLEQIIEGFNPIDIYNTFLPDHGCYKYVLSVQLSNPVLSRPTITEKDGSTKVMMPNDARLRNLSYASPLSVNVAITARTYNPEAKQYMVETKAIDNVSLGRLPVMVRSRYCMLSKQPVPSPQDECRYDYGGYFIVNGNEKVVISQDRIAENRTYVFLNTKTSSAYSHVAEIRSVQEARFGVPKTTALRLSSKANQFGRCVRMTIHHVRQDIPVFIVFRALGVISDRDIVRHVLYDETDPANEDVVRELAGCMDDASCVRTQADALEFIAQYLNGTATMGLHHHAHTQPTPPGTGGPGAGAGMTTVSSRANAVRHVLRKDVLPHVGSAFANKALYLGHMLCKLIRGYLGLDALYDRDSFINKRLDPPGGLMATLFRQYFGKVVKDMRTLVQRDIKSCAWRTANHSLISIIHKSNIYKLIKPTIIEGGIKYSLATGNWGVKTCRVRQGVAQVLNRMTYMASLSHLRRVNTPIEKAGKLVQPRKLHPTQWGVICPSECFDPHTPILMWDGTIREAKEIAVGDHLIDDTGNAVRVKSTCAGVKTMYDVIPCKDNFMRYTVTDNHILTLKVKKHKKVRARRGKKELSWFDKEELRYRYREFHDEEELRAFSSTLDDDNVIDITIEKYQSLPKYVRNNLYVFKSAGINWEHAEVALDPYMLGMWLGDGLSSGYGFITADAELLAKWTEWAAENGATITPCKHRYRYYISCTENRWGGAAPLKSLLSKYGLVKHKHIPREYLVNDRKTRLTVLAGLVDTDGNVRANGHEIRICQGEPNYRIIHDAEFLARSLGFSCHVNDGICSYTVKGEKRQKPYKELTITGPRLYEIPTVLPRKKLHRFEDPATEKRCFLQSSFKLVEKDVQPFVGWQLEGNGRFLLGDMSVVHNTPEGASVGLVKNLALLVSVSRATPSQPVRDALVQLGIVPFVGDPGIFARGALRIFVNGDLLGTHADPPALYAALKARKRCSALHAATSIVWDVKANALSLCTEGGRFVRPLFVVNEDGTGLAATEDVLRAVLAGRSGRGAAAPSGGTSWDVLVRTGVVEYMDVEETNAALIAMTPTQLLEEGKAGLRRHTHMELTPNAMLGVVAGSIPFSDHNQAPRNTYQSAMGKQAIGIAASNYRHRYDTMTHVLNYPQKPLVSTHTARIMNCDELPCGINATVAIACFTGFNQEDSVIVSKSAVDRGLFVSTFYRTLREQNGKNHSTGEEEFFCRPDPLTVRGFKAHHNYAKLAPTGFVPEDTYVDSGDVIVGKVMPHKQGPAVHNKDSSITLKSNERGYVDRNCHGDRYFTNVTGDGYTFAKVRLRNQRVPTIGDKVSSRSGQKGTIGMMYTDADMPYTASGMVPSLIMNPHAIPSRMTIGQLMEALDAKAGAFSGRCGDATPFNGRTVEDMAEELEALGMERYGNEVMYNPRTGEQVACAVFIAPTYYQRLKHMVDDKIHCLSEDHDVLTARGWVPIADVTEQDKVATLHEGQRLVYERPLEVMRYPEHVGPLYSVQGPAVDLLTTMEHRMYVAPPAASVSEEGRHQDDGDVAPPHYDLVAARDLLHREGPDGGDERVRYKRDAVWPAQEFQFMLPALRAADGSYIAEGVPLPMEPWLDLYGLWAGGACAVALGDEDGPAGADADAVSVLCPLALVPTLHGALGALGLAYTVSVGPPQRVFIGDVRLRAYLRDALALQQRMPEWVWRLSASQAARLLRAMTLHTDGAAFKAFRPAADDFLRLCLHAGTSGTMVPAGAAASGMWMVGVAKGAMDNRPADHMSHATPEDVPCPVYCLRVPSEVFYVRRNGKPCWTGNSRAANGPVVLLTRQPAEGRARDGGLRLGEMELECLWAHGSLSLLKERFMECSDNYRVFVCKLCGMMAPVNPERGLYHCAACKNMLNFAELRIPYACKLFLSELAAMSIGTRFIT